MAHLPHGTLDSGALKNASGHLFDPAQQLLLPQEIKINPSLNVLLQRKLMHKMLGIRVLKQPKIH